MGKRNNNNNGGNKYRGRSRSRSRANGGNRNRSNHQGNTPSSKATKKPTSVKDCLYNVGQAKNASEFVTYTGIITEHIQMTYKRGLDMATALKERKHFDFETIKPELKVSEAKEADKKENENNQFLKQFEIEYKSYDERVQQYDENKGKAAGLLYNRCSSSMRAKLKARDDYKDIIYDPVELLKATQQIQLNSLQATSFYRHNKFNRTVYKLPKTKH